MGDGEPAALVDRQPVGSGEAAGQGDERRHFRGRAVGMERQAADLVGARDGPYTQGDIDDGDTYGGQQHAPLVDLDIPD
jgi:hypothetical protein